MDEGDGDCALADGGGDALDVAAAHVADRKDSGTARFEQIGRPVQRPRAAARSSCERSGPVLMNPLLSRATQPPSQPVFGTAPVMTNTWRMSLVCASPFRLSRQRTCSRCPSPCQCDDLGMRVQDDRGVLFDAANEIARHRVRQPLGADQHVHALRASAREIPRPDPRSCRRR